MGDGTGHDGNPAGVPKYDWDAIELDYRAGLLPLQSICAKHGCSIARLSTVAKQKKWVRLAPDLAHSMGLAGATNAKDARHSIYDEADLQRIVNMDAAALISTHRKDIARLRLLAQTLTERLALHLNGQTSPFPFMAERETPATLLETLSRIQARYIPLEREAFGLAAGALAINSSEPDGNAVLDEMKEIMLKLDDMARAKAESGD